MGTRIASVLVAGVVLAELTKQVSAPVGPGSLVSVRSPLQVLEGIRRPHPARPVAPHASTREPAP